MNREQFNKTNDLVINYYNFDPLEPDQKGLIPIKIYLKFNHKQIDLQASDNLVSNDNKIKSIDDVDSITISGGIYGPYGYEKSDETQKNTIILEKRT